MLVRPTIWIEEEQKMIAQGLIPPPQPEYEKIPPALPESEEVTAVLQAIITDILTDVKLRDLRDEHFLAKKPRAIYLENGGEYSWPKSFKPESYGYTLLKPDAFVINPPIMGMRIDKFDLKKKKGAESDAPIQIHVFDAGRSVFSAAELLYYQPQRVGKSWKVERVEPSGDR